MPTTTTLVIGATGATGKYVVKQLLERDQIVKVVVRSKQRMMDLLQEMNKNGTKVDITSSSNLQITEASFLDLSDTEVEDLIKGCTAAVSCLGHNMTFQGLYGKPRRLVTDSVQRLTSAIAKVNPSCKFVLMGTDGVSNPSTDDQRSVMERIILFLLRHLLPPHADNEAVAEYLLNYNSGKKQVLGWSIVRPTDLQNGGVCKYKLYDKPPGGLFGSGICTRANVAAFMVQLIVDTKTWEQYKFQMPVIHDDVADDDETKKGK